MRYRLRNSIAELKLIPNPIPDFKLPSLTLTSFCIYILHSTWQTGCHIHNGIPSIRVSRVRVTLTVTVRVSRVPTFLESPGFFGYNFQVLESPGIF